VLHAHSAAELAAAALAKGNKEAGERLYAAIKQADQLRHQVAAARGVLAADEIVLADAQETLQIGTAAAVAAQATFDAAQAAFEAAKVHSDAAAAARAATTALQAELALLEKQELRQRAEVCEGVTEDAVAAAAHQKAPKGHAAAEEEQEVDPAQAALIALIVQHTCPPDPVAWETAERITADAQKFLYPASEVRQEAMAKLQDAQAAFHAAESARNRSARDLSAKQAAEREAVAAAATALDDGATVAQDLSGRSGWTALHLGAKAGHVALCELFVERGADLEARDNYNGTTALHSASAYGHTEVVALLLRRGADPNVVLLDSDGETPLMMASAFGHVEAVAELLHGGATLNATDIHGDSALHITAKRLQVAAYHALVEAGANTELRNNDAETAGDIMAAKKLKEAIKQNDRAAAVAALSAGVSLAQKLDSYRRDALHLAAKAGYVGLCELFVERGADLDAKDSFAMTALHSASAYGHTEVVSVLTHHGADANAANHEGVSALMLAGQYGHAETMREILRGGADIDATDKKLGESALHKSAKSGRKEAVRLLLSAGCDSGLVTKDGKNVAVVLWEAPKVKASRKAEIAKLLENP
jgi:ankyrin repeat protein